MTVNSSRSSAADESSSHSHEQKPLAVSVGLNSSRQFGFRQNLNRHLLGITKGDGNVDLTLRLPCQGGPLLAIRGLMTIHWIPFRKWTTSMIARTGAENSANRMLNLMT